MQTSTQNGGLHFCFLRLPLLGGFYANFWKLHLNLDCFGAIV